MRTIDIPSVIGRHRVLFTEPPAGTPADHAIDGPLLGNGDLGVAMSGRSWEQRYWIAKNDFWKLRKGRRFGGGAAPIGGIDLQIRDLFRVGSYRIEQDLYHAETVGDFSSDRRRVRTMSWVAADCNLLVVDVECVESGSKQPTRFEPELWIQNGRGSEAEVHPAAELCWGSRRFAVHCDVETGAAVAAAVFLAPGDAEGDALGFTLAPGGRAALVVAVCTNFEHEDYRAAAQNSIESLRKEGYAGIEALRESHRAWWAGFWHESAVCIDDKAIERQYYLSQYILASASRNPRFPPPIFGTWITTDDPAWMGDYHLNYNHMAPYYGLYSSNHLVQAAPYEAPILDFADRGRWYARELLGVQGIYLPVGIGPLGVETTWDPAPVDHLRPHYEGEGLFFGQKSNASYAVVNMAMRWLSTYDPAYAQRVYPFVQDVAEFWENYLTWDGERYVSEADSIHEGSGLDLNPILSLGLIPCILETAIDMSRELGLAEERHSKWRHIVDHLSSFPTQERNCATVFRLSETGADWWKSNTLTIQHIYPAGTIGPDSDPELLRIARDTITALDRWFDLNGMSSLYPAAVRVGYDPEILLARLREHCQMRLHPNGFMAGNPHGVETCSTVPNTINEMLCCSHGGTIRLFRNWPRDRNAEFLTLRAYGAFLVSASLTDGEVSEVEILSERGRVCRIVSPWPDAKVSIERPGGRHETVDGGIVEFPTTAAGVYRLSRSE